MKTATLFTYFIMPILFVLSEQAGAYTSAVSDVAGATSNAVAENFDAADEREKECKKLDRESKQADQMAQASQGAQKSHYSQQHKKKEKEKKECEVKKAAKQGQGMGNLGQLPMQQAAQNQSADSGGQGFGAEDSSPADEPFNRKLAAIIENGDPMDSFRDPVFGKELLTRSGLSPSKAERVLGQFAKAEAQGIGFDPQTQEVTTPFGSISAAALNSASGMKAMGFSNAEIQAEMEKQEEDLADLYKKVALKSTEGGGGGKSRAPKISNEFDLPDIPTFGVNSLNKDIRNGKRGYFQLTRNIAGGRIGVASDNIFRMVTRRYQKKASVNHFLP